KSFQYDEDDYDSMEHYHEDNPQSGPENIEEIVRETVDTLVAITLCNTAPYIVNMLTAMPNNGNNTNIESKNITSINTMKSQSNNSKPDYHRSDLALLSSTANDLRNSTQQTSPIKQQQQQIHHPQLIIQPATTTNPISTIQGTNTPTLIVAPRILN
ncbi:unnamed protein product, partial [Adineta steineri]